LERKDVLASSPKAPTFGFIFKKVVDEKLALAETAFEFLNKK